MTRAKDAFVKHLRRTGNVSGSCDAAAISRTTAYKWRKDDETFASRWHEAEEAALDEIEEAMRKRAIDGTEKPVFYQGAECGTVIEYSDSNAQFLMKHKRYREEKVEVTGKDGAPLPANIAPLVVNFVTPDKKD